MNKGPAIMTTKDVAEYLRVPVTTIYRWNLNDEGPRRIRLGRHLRYRKSDVDEWLDRRIVGEVG